VSYFDTGHHFFSVADRFEGLKEPVAGGVLQGNAGMASTVGLLSRLLLDRFAWPSVYFIGMKSVACEPA
jgi:hypothetical protein